MLLEILVVLALAVGGTIVLILWIDLRVALDTRGLATLGALILTTVVAASVALRVTALAFPMGSVPALIIALAGWSLVIRLTTRPRRALSSLGDEGEGRAGVG